MTPNAMNPRVLLEYEGGPELLVSMGRNEQIGVTRQAKIPTLARIE
jgi:hypothetical protein